VFCLFYLCYTVYCFISCTLAYLSELINCVQVKDVRWDSELGGQNMELQLVEYFADEFNKQVGNGVDVRKSAKAMAKLKKQVKRTKEILSANTMAPISVESLYDDRDFR
jgi:hypoxia up-regulated 1